MKRILINDLQKWKEKSGRKPLILQGARQVGKTWLSKVIIEGSMKGIIRNVFFVRVCCLTDRMESC